MSGSISHGSLLGQINNCHSNIPLCGEPKNQLLTFPDKHILYLVSIIRDEPPLHYDFSVEDWNCLIEALRPHWIIPLLYYKISFLDKEQQPPLEIIDKLRDAYMVSSAHTMLARSQLKEVISAFNKTNVEMIVLKGAHYAQSIYPTPATRPASDIDLLVPKSQYLKARDVMEKIGYDLYLNLFDKFSEIYCEEIYVHKNRKHNIHVELHWDLHQYFGQDQYDEVVKMIDRAVVIESSGLYYRALDPVDDFVFCALHAFMIHVKGTRLIWIYDCALLADRLVKSDDQVVLQNRCSELGARFAVENMIAAISLWTNLKVPSALLNIDSWPPPKDKDYILGGNFANHNNQWLQFKLQLSKLQTINEKFSYILYRLFPPISEMKKYYPQASHKPLLFSYLHRLWKILITN